MNYLMLARFLIEQNLLSVAGIIFLHGHIAIARDMPA
jgi:hypothetical protein